MVNTIQDEVAPDKSEQKTMEGSVSHESQCEQIENVTILSELPRKETDDFQNGEIVSHEEQQRQGSSFSNGLAVVYSVSKNLQQGQSSDVGSCGSPSFTAGMQSSAPEIAPDQQSGQNLSAGNHLLQCDKQIRTPSRYPVKLLEDGYNWRKYGQKLVKGNEFVRSYYRCTHLSCRAKRQVERSQDGRITDTVYIGAHEHVKPQLGSQTSLYSVSPIQSIGPDVGPIATDEAPSSHEAKPMGSPQRPTTPTKNDLDDSNSQPVQPKLTRDEINHDGDSPLKRQKRDRYDVDEIPVEKPYGEPRFVGEPRVVVQTMSEVDILQDGYRWRKYGQKLVKGNPNPRSYYRCSSSSCPAKKHVERAPHDAKAVITTYEGQHDHDMPPTRTVTLNRVGAAASTTSLEDETRPKPVERPAVGLEMDMVVHISAFSAN